MQHISILTCLFNFYSITYITFATVWNLHLPLISIYVFLNGVQLFQVIHFPVTIASYYIYKLLQFFTWFRLNWIANLILNAIKGVPIRCGWKVVVAYVNLAKRYVIGFLIGCVLGFMESMGALVNISKSRNWSP